MTHYSYAIHHDNGNNSSFGYTLDHQNWRIEKRVANTEEWKVVGHAATKAEAIGKANAVLGGTSTGVRICQTDSPYRTPEVIVGD